MEFMVACNWEEDLLDKIDYPEVTTLFGCLPDTIIPGGRPSSILKSISYEEFRNYVKRVHEKGWFFDYTINSTCLGNMEFSSEGHKQILNHIEGLLEAGVDSFTISVTTLIEIVKKHFPGVKIKASTLQRIDTVAMAQKFEDLGADVIMVSEHINRDFELLSAIRRSVKSKLALIANVGCIYGCHNMHSHSNSTSHNTKNGNKSMLSSEYYQANCMLTRMSNPVELVKSRWIRPEDVKVYEDIGIDMLKILERNSTSDTLGERVKAYSERSFDGNLIDLMGQIFNRKKSIPPSLVAKYSKDRNENMKKIGDFFRAFFQAEISDLFYLDNKKIPKDFINGFMNRDCSKLSCDKCNYCKSIADTCMTHADQSELDQIVKTMRSAKAGIIEGATLV
ncbi:MAG: Peptidase family U32 [Firmicutes bacterium ADurb.Bin419]|nr:MAG: Peptidase family U32 [Firmicutes bacterium ADurb.Bin419]